MSSTSRSKSRESHIADYYVTPHYAINDFINAAQEKCPSIFENIATDVILDPCAGVTHGMK